MNNLAKPKINIPRTLASIVILSVTVGLQLYIFAEYFHDSVTFIEDLSTKSTENTIWLYTHIVYLLPVLVVVILQAIIYGGKKQSSPAKFYKEKALQSVAIAFITFGVMLPFVIWQSNKAELIEPEVVDGVVKEIIPLLDRTIMWFARQIVPFLILIMYHNVRYQTEVKQLEEENLCVEIPQT